jgi:outer membrane lipoprotein-sorting protein
MTIPIEEDFQSAYAVYDRNHATLRDDLLGRLSQRPAISRRLRLLPAAAVAALIVGMGIAGFWTMRPAPAFGLDGLRERLQALRSLHLKGAVFQRTQTQFGVATIRFPVERYYERPSRYFGVGYGFSSNGNDNLVQVTRTYTVNDGRRSLLVLDDQNKAILSTHVDPLETELMIENALQVNEAHQLVRGNPDEFEHVGSERVDGKQCDIYQSKNVGARHFETRIWIDRSSGLPVRIVATTRDSNGEAEPAFEYSEIRANVDPPAELFTFEVPPGYEVSELKDSSKSRKIHPTGSCEGGNHGAAVWQGLNIDDRAVLVCWSQWLKNKDLKTFFHDPPRLMVHGLPDRPCTEQVLYETVSGDYRWRWSLVRPDDDEPIGKNPLLIKYRYPKEELSLEVQPLVFSEPRLAEIVEKAQRRSLEASGDFSQVKSLAQLRAVIAKRPSATSGD